MGKKLTHDEFVGRMKLVNPNIKIIGKYINSSTKIKCKCLTHNVVWSAKPSQLLNNHGCKKCGAEKISNKLSGSHNIFINKLFNLNPNIQILDQYVNNHTYVRCKCKIDDYEWSAKPANLLNGYGCPKCAGNITKTTKEFIAEMNNINSNIEIIGKYKNRKTNILCKCKIHNYTWYAKPSNLLLGINCPICEHEKMSKNNKRRKTNDEFVKEIYNINPNIKLLSEYYNAKTNVLCECLIDHNIFYMSPRLLLRGEGCDICGIEKRKGENNPSWNGGISSLQNYLRKSINPWKRDSFINSNFTCDISGMNKNLIIHHKYGFNLIVKETLQQTNLPLYRNINKYSQDELSLLSKTCLELHYKHGLGVCLNDKIHKNFHKLYGNKNNTPEQYEEFKNKCDKVICVNKSTSILL